MADWKITGEEANIVLIGNFNPKIFHPEWFIRKNIVEEWDYSGDDLANLGDLTKFTLPGDISIEVLLNRFTIRSPLASNHLLLKDILIGTFNSLPECPITQMGMNYITTVNIPNTKQWAGFGKNFAPMEPWEDSLEYIKDIPKEKLKDKGLWEIVMHFPRIDKYHGHIRPKINAVDGVKQVLQFGINDHIDLDPQTAENLIEIINGNWEESLSRSKNIIESILNSQLS